jgi:hypothetical protein
MMKRMGSEHDIRHENRRVGLMIIAAVGVLYLVAIIGVLVLN